jgi:hypothetical protein
MAGLIRFPSFADPDGELCVYENATGVPFNIARTFHVSARMGQIRGQHAHRHCAQLLICTAGAIDAVVDDGTHRLTFRLDAPNLGLILPPTLWSEQIYLSEPSLLMVLCDRPYEADDYIRDYDTFRVWRRASSLVATTP